MTVHNGHTRGKKKFKLKESVPKNLTVTLKQVTAIYSLIQNNSSAND